MQKSRTSHGSFPHEALSFIHRAISVLDHASRPDGLIERRYQKGLADSEEEAAWNEGDRRGADEVPLRDLESSFSNLEVQMNAAQAQGGSHGNGVEGGSGETSTKADSTADSTAIPFSAYKDKWRLQASDHTDAGGAASNAKGGDNISGHAPAEISSDHVTDGTVEIQPDGVREAAQSL